MGSFNDKEQGQLDLLDLSSWTWETGNPYFTDICDFGTLYYDGNMFVFGGFSRQLTDKLDSIESYNPKTNTWTNRGRLLNTRNGHDVIFSSNFFLVLGDHEGDNHKSEKCGFIGSSLVCEELQSIFGSVE